MCVILLRSLILLLFVSDTPLEIAISLHLNKHNILRVIHMILYYKLLDYCSPFLLNSNLSERFFSYKILTRWKIKTFENVQFVMQI